jgi:hypothetical protein
MSAALRVLHVDELPDDRLEVVYSDGEQEFTALGWASALDNYYEPAAYAEPGPCDHCETEAADGKGGLKTVKLEHQPGDRHLDAKPRAMSDDEIAAYALELARADHQSRQPAARVVRWQP